MKLFHISFTQEMDSETKIKCEAATQQQLSEKARKLIDDIQEIMKEFQLAWKRGRTGDTSVMVEQVLQSFSDLKAEINASSPASPIPVDSLGSFSEDIQRMLQLYDEQGDATSTLVELAGLEPEPDTQSFQTANFTAAQEADFVNFEQQVPGSQEFYQCGINLGMHHTDVNDSDLSAQFDFLNFDFHQDNDHGHFGEANDAKQIGRDVGANILPLVNPPPSAFLGPKCALWDCQRPAQGSEWCLDYCSTMHADLALSEGSPGMKPVLRPGGIGLKDDRLLSSLVAKMQGKNVGIPECHGAAIEKSPWNASNYSGRGWHESRKLLMKELGGRKRSYYMDPQPPGSFEWHLFEYEIISSDCCALYKLELKLVSVKKSPKGKSANDSVVDLQKQMGRLTADVSPDTKLPVKGRTKADLKADSEC
ncbi:transcription factor VOZ1-like isoform X3 [Rhodamnia argentea]|uniref:Transcription factor VOZ1-like isoform X3 n=1 Tax=Rhodamnia argentea TaxID=178133 RepID=A0ABM3GRP7_9MYRT|nr:transcription factor VOZ1-like isoform X3 [Rhodamnia argentea]